MSGALSNAKFLGAAFVLSALMVTVEKFNEPPEGQAEYDSEELMLACLQEKEMLAEHDVIYSGNFPARLPYGEDFECPKEPDRFKNLQKFPVKVRVTSGTEDVYVGLTSKWVERKVDDVGNSEYLFEDECNGGEKKQVSVQGDEVTISYSLYRGDCSLKR